MSSPPLRVFLTREQERTWQPEDIEYLEQCLEKEQRTYNSKQLAAKLKQERQVNLSPDLVRHLLKKKNHLETQPPLS